MDFFQKELGIQLKVFDGGARRTNLEFVVVKTGVGDKFSHVHQVLTADLPEDEPGGAIVYCATRRQTEELAEFLQLKGIKADHFHARLPRKTKKNVQERFIDGDLRVIVATNAFGMGIDKPDVRLVIHADIRVPWKTTFRRQVGPAGTSGRPVACCSTPWMTWSGSSGCPPGPGSPGRKSTAC